MPWFYTTNNDGGPAVDNGPFEDEQSAQVSHDAVLAARPQDTPHNVREESEGYVTVQVREAVYYTIP
jgi:hypothetical protein